MLLRPRMVNQDGSGAWSPPLNTHQRHSLAASYHCVWSDGGSWCHLCSTSVRSPIPYTSVALFVEREGRRGPGREHEHLGLQPGRTHPPWPLSTCPGRGQALCNNWSSHLSGSLPRAVSWEPAGEAIVLRNGKVCEGKVLECLYGE